MADNTGAPHFIPYVEPTDLVREYPAADEASAFAVAAALDGIPVLAGIGANAVQTAKTDVFTSTTSASVPTPIPGLSVTITPTSETSKVLLIAQLSLGNAGNDNRGIGYLFGGGNTSAYRADAVGSRRQAIINDGRAFNLTGINGHSMVTLDAPATTSAVTYTVDFIGPAGVQAQIVLVNRSSADPNDTSNGRGASSITAIEVAA